MRMRKKMISEIGLCSVVFGKLLPSAIFSFTKDEKRMWFRPRRIRLLFLPGSKSQFVNEGRLVCSFKFEEVFSGHFSTNRAYSLTGWKKQSQVLFAFIRDIFRISIQTWVSPFHPLAVLTGWNPGLNPTLFEPEERKKNEKLVDE